MSDDNLTGYRKCYRKITVSALMCLIRLALYIVLIVIYCVCYLLWAN